MTDWFNVCATASTIYNIMTMQLLFGFIVSYYIVENEDIWSYATTIDQTSDDDLRIRFFYLGAFLATIPAAFVTKAVGVRWTILIASLAFACLLPIISVVQESNHPSFMFLLTLAGALFGVAQLAIIQGACMVEVIGQSCRMGRFYSFSQICTIFGLLAGTQLAQNVGHPGSFPSLNTFSIALATIVVSSLLTFWNMYNFVQEQGVRERVASWSSSPRRSSFLLSGGDSMRASLLQDDEFIGGAGKHGGGGGAGRLLHAPLEGGGAEKSSSSSSSTGAGALTAALHRLARTEQGNDGGFFFSGLARWAWMQVSRPDVQALLVVTLVTTFVIDTLEYWSYSYFQDALGVTGGARTWGVVGTRASLCVGFALSDFIRPVFALRQWRVVLTCSAGAILGVVLFLSAAAAPAGAAALGLATTGSILAGVALAPLIPVCVSVAYNLPDATPGVGVAAVLAVSYISHMLASSLIGALAEASGVAGALLTLLVVVVLVPAAGQLPTALCLLLDFDAFQLPTPIGVQIAGESSNRDSYGWS